MELKALILAAGQGTRMKSNVPKVIHKVNGITILERVIQAVSPLTEQIGIVLGNGFEIVKNSLPKNKNLHLFLQKERLGTGHAVKEANSFFEDFNGYVLILPGDTPLLQSEELNDFVLFAIENKSDCSILAFKAKNPHGYGRIIDKENQFVKIAEEKDASDEEKKINTVNSGIYLFKANILKNYLNKLSNNNAQKEYYLTDIPALMKKDKKSVTVFSVNNEENFIGVNSRVQLAEADKIAVIRKLHTLMLNGVTVLNPETVRIEESVTIGRDSIIYPCSVITKNTVIGRNCVIQNGVCIENSEIGDNCQIKPYCTIEDSFIGDNSTVGPMANLRPGTVLQSKVKVGNFVETKKAVLKDGVKASHLTYLGDCEIGENTNIGAGTITCNYDGKNKHKTTIGKNCFIGSDTQLVAPVSLEDNSYVGAGSTITKNVPKYSLALSRVKQTIIKNWAKKKEK
jgi:bifunctional UDP-N-acetylglucosamine pyrophosphorylase/glucosamine-1-phosphate N-acetyltransferase